MCNTVYFKYLKLFSYLLSYVPVFVQKTHLTFNILVNNQDLYPQNFSSSEDSLILLKELTGDFFALGLKLFLSFCYSTY